MNRLSVRRGTTLALDGLRFELSLGARVLLLGSAGSGKTTLLKALVGLLPTPPGEICWSEAGARLRRSDECPPPAAFRSRFGMVFQSDALFDSETVRDNVLLPLRKRQVPSDEAERRVQEALQQVGLGLQGDALPSELSGGMRKRVGIARALVARPEVLVADDPMAGLDPQTEREIAALLVGAERNPPRTLILASAQPIAGIDFNRWLVLSRGRLIHDGGPNPDVLSALGEEEAAAAMTEVLL